MKVGCEKDLEEQSEWNNLQTNKKNKQKYASQEWRVIYRMRTENKITQQEEWDVLNSRKGKKMIIIIIFLM